MNRAVGLLLALVLLAPLAGCGGGDSEDSTGTSAASTAAKQGGTSTEKRSPQGKGGSAEKPKQSGGKSQPQDTGVGNPVPGTKEPAPGVPVAKGGDNSIQTYGVEGDVDPRDQAAANVTAYLSAFEAGQWPKACALASNEYRRQLAQLIARARARDGATKPRGCAAVIEALFTKTPKSARRALTQIDEVLSFRVEEDHAYLIFKGAKGAVMFIAMADDDGEWKVNVIQPSPFPGANQAGGQ
jgi:hypothetical protein